MELANGGRLPQVAGGNDKLIVVVFFSPPQAFQRQVHERLTQLELINKQYRRLARENRTDAASKLKVLVHEGNQRWDGLQRRVAAVLRRLKVRTRETAACRSLPGRPQRFSKPAGLRSELRRRRGATLAGSWSDGGRSCSRSCVSPQESADPG